MIISETVYNELLRTDGVKRQALDKLLSIRNIHLASVDYKLVHAIRAYMWAKWINKGALPLNIMERQAFNRDVTILAEARVLNAHLATQNARDFLHMTIGPGRRALAERAGVRLLRTGMVKRTFPTLELLSRIIMRRFFKG